MLATLMTLAAEGPNGRWIPSDAKEFWWGLIAFSIVMFLMATRLFPVINKGLDQARTDAANEAAAGEEAMLRTQAEATRLRAELGDADVAGEQLIADAHNTAAQIRADGAERTAASVADLRARGAADIDSMRAQASSDIQNEIGTKAMGAAEAMVTANLDDATQASLIEDYIAKIGASS